MGVLALYLSNGQLHDWKWHMANLDGRGALKPRSLLKRIKIYRPQPIPLSPIIDVDAQAKLHQLCDKCLEICQQSQILHGPTRSLDADEPVEEQFEAFTHHASIRAMIFEAEKGCHLCSLIARDVKHFDREINRSTEAGHGMRRHHCVFPFPQSSAQDGSYRLVLSGAWQKFTYYDVDKASSCYHAGVRLKAEVLEAIDQGVRLAPYGSSVYTSFQFPSSLDVRRFGGQYTCVIGDPFANLDCRLIAHV